MMRSKISLLFYCSLRSALMAVLLAWLIFAPATPTVAQQPDDLPGDARSAIAAAIGRDRVAYHFNAVGSGYAVANSAHGLAVTFDAAGMRLRRDALNWSLTFTGYGYGDRIQTFSSSPWVAAANRLERRHGVALVEWYINSPMGLEHGFDVALPPAGARSAAEPLTLVLAQSGNAQAALAGDRLGVILANGLSYTGLTVYDATGRTLSAWLELDGDRLLVRVNDDGASYPLRIDPWFQSARLIASDGGEFDRLGAVSAMSGDVIVVGAEAANVDGLKKAGAAYVFTKPLTGWSGELTESAKLAPSRRGEADLFGASVAIYGDVIVVGADNADANGTADAGAAYVFVKPANGWTGLLTETATLIASDRASHNTFGGALAIHEDVIAVGSHNANLGGTAYVFTKPVAGWAGTLTEVAKLSASDTAYGDSFGRSVVISDDIIAVGADGATVGEQSRAGAAYVFVRPETGWAGNLGEAAKLTASDAFALDMFGGAMALADDTLVIGADRADPGGVSAAGAAYVFTKPVNGWVGSLHESAKLTASDKYEGDWFGGAVAIHRDVIVVGANVADPDGVVNAGAAYVYPKPVGGWAGALTEAQKFSALDKAESDMFAFSIALNDEVIAFGAGGARPGGLDSAGAVYIFDSNPQITLSKSANPSSAAPGQTVTYTIAFQNTTPIILGNIMITDTLPALITNPSFVSSGAALTQVPGSNYVWRVSDLGLNQGGIISVTGVLPKPLAAQTFTNSVILTGKGVVKLAAAPLTVLNVPPVADAGPDQLVSLGRTVALDGSDSSDDNGDTLVYGWAQTGGAMSGVLNNPAAPVATFTAPTTNTLLGFTLTVTDSAGLTSSDVVTVAVTVYASAPTPGGVLNVGTTKVGSTITTTLSISKAASVPLNVTGHALAGTNSADFDVTPGTLSIPDGGAAQPLYVSCTPGDFGLRTATLSVYYNAPGSPATYTLRCTGGGMLYLPVVLRQLLFQ